MLGPLAVIAEQLNRDKCVTVWVAWWQSSEKHVLQQEEVFLHKCAAEAALANHIRNYYTYHGVAYNKNTPDCEIINTFMSQTSGTPKDSCGIYRTGLMTHTAEEIPDYIAF
jgi:lipoate-protein ligase B